MDPHVHHRRALLTRTPSNCLRTGITIFCMFQQSYTSDFFSNLGPDFMQRPYLSAFKTTLDLFRFINLILKAWNYNEMKMSKEFSTDNRPICIKLAIFLFPSNLDVRNFWHVGSHFASQFWTQQPRLCSPNDIRNISEVRSWTPEFSAWIKWFSVYSFRTTFFMWNQQNITLENMKI
jgi:hypothetical protein